LVLARLTYNFGMEKSETGDQIDISWAACPRWATFESSDLVDAVEQLGGRWAILLVDVQGSGRGGRRLASLVAREARELLAAGISAETTVRAVHEHLHELRQGKVGASIHICEIDPTAELAKIVGLGILTVAAGSADDWTVDFLNGPPAGFDRSSDVLSLSFSFGVGALIVLANDGVARGADDLTVLLASRRPADNCTGAHQLLSQAIQRDSGRPRSDMAVAVIGRAARIEGPPILEARISVPVKRFGSDL
jgi:hypothetical protein